MRKGARFTVVGEGPDGWAIISGVYRFFETTGIPLEMLFDELAKRKEIPCWVTFHREAQRAGIQHSRILSRLREALLDNGFPRGTREYVLHALETLHEMDHPCLKLDIPWRYDAAPIASEAHR